MRKVDAANTDSRPIDIDNLLNRVRKVQHMLGDWIEHPNEDNSSEKVAVDSSTPPRHILHSQGAPVSNYNPTPTAEIMAADDLLCDQQMLQLATFMRISIDRLTWTRIPDQVLEVPYGQFILEYKIPCTDAASDELKKRCRSCTRNLIDDVVIFKHRRVIRVNPNIELLNCWSQSNLILSIYYQISKIGKFAKKPLCRAVIAMSDLMVFPYAIDVVAPLFAPDSSCVGRLNVSIFFGSKCTVFQERVAAARPHTTLPQRSSVAANSSTASYSKNSRIPPLTPRSTSGNRNGGYQPIIRPPTDHNLIVRPRIDLSRLNASPSPINNRDLNMDSLPAPRTPPLRTSSASSSSNSSDASIHDGYRLKLTVHGARSLPLVKGPNLAPSRPNVYVSYRGDRHLEVSPVISNSTNPVWEWTSNFSVPSERKNIVLKLWHRCPTKGDQVLGFVSVDLPPMQPLEAITGDYDLVDLSRSSSGLVKLTLSPLRTRLLASVSSQRRPTPLLSSSGIDSFVSRAALVDQLRTNMEQLDMMMRRLPA